LSLRRTAFASERSAPCLSWHVWAYGALAHAKARGISGGRAVVSVATRAWLVLRLWYKYTYKRLHDDNLVLAVLFAQYLGAFAGAMTEADHLDYQV
jgi:hypothetical protein